MFERIVRHAADKVQAGLSPDFLFITGDIADRGRTEEYDLFNFEFLASLQDALPKSTEVRTFAVPGNHDVDRQRRQAFDPKEMADPAKQYFDTGEEGRLQREILFPRFQAFSDNDVTAPKGLWLMSPEGSFVTQEELSGVSVTIVGINTAWLSKISHGSRVGWRSIPHDDRKQASLDGYFTGLIEVPREGIAAVAMDMWAPYVESVRTHVPDGASKIVFDRFHIMGHVGDAVDRVRKAEHRALRAAGDETLTGTKYLWLYGAERMPEKHQDRFLAVQALELKTARAWVIKETLRHLWSYRREGWARRHWTGWYFWATHSRLQPVIEAARLIQRHLPNVMTYFTHRITNAVSEGLNSYGFRNREHFKTAIYFHCGGLNLYPVTH